MKCPHPEFRSSVSVVKSDRSRFLATVKIRCARCGERFQFFGSAPGLDLNGISTSADGQELLCAVGTPESLREYYEQASGMRLPDFKKDERHPSTSVIEGPVEPYIRPAKAS